MTASSVLFDTWAWWEVLHGTTLGKKLARRYVEAPGVRLHTSALSFGEIAAKLAAMGAEDRLPELSAAMRAAGEVHDVTHVIAQEGGTLRQELRQRAPDASLADGIILAQARSLGATIVSRDPAFRGMEEVKDS